MRSQSADAAAKLILLGEHAVVYGHAALAIPLGKPRAMAVVSRAAAEVYRRLEGYKDAKHPPSVTEVAATLGGW